MNKYKFSFIGRQSGAIGIFYPIRETYKAANIDEAMSLLYEDYEHFKELKINKNGVQIDEPEKINFVKVRSHRERTIIEKTGSYQYSRDDESGKYNY